MQHLQVVPLILGEILLAEVHYSALEKKVTIKVPSPYGGSHVLERNEYDTVPEAVQAAKKLVPVECREHIRELPSMFWPTTPERKS